MPKEEEEKDSTGVNSELGMEKGLKIQEFYKIPNQLFPLLPQGAKPKYLLTSPPLTHPTSPFLSTSTKRDHYLHQEAVSVLWGYVDRNQLVPSEDRSVVMVDKFLALKVLGIKTGETPRVKKGELAQQ